MKKSLLEKYAQLLKENVFGAFKTDDKEMYLLYLNPSYAELKSCVPDARGIILADGNFYLLDSEFHTHWDILGMLNDPEWYPVVDADRNTVERVLSKVPTSYRDYALWMDSFITVQRQYKSNDIYLGESQSKEAFDRKGMEFKDNNVQQKIKNIFENCENIYKQKYGSCFLNFHVECISEKY